MGVLGPLSEDIYRFMTAKTQTGLSMPVAIQYGQFQSRLAN